MSNQLSVMSKNYDVMSVLVKTCEDKGVRLQEGDLADGYTVSRDNKVMILHGSAAKFVEGVLKSGGDGSGFGDRGGFFHDIILENV